MAFTATQIRLPATAKVRAGQFVRFSAVGGLLEITDRLFNGLGTIYRANSDGTFSRYHF